MSDCDTKQGLINPDRAGKVHRPHDRFTKVSTACGATRLGLTWRVDLSTVRADQLCPRCFPSESTA